MLYEYCLKLKTKNLKLKAKMLDYIEQLRKKSIHTRKLILVTITVTITGIIFIVWVYFWVGAVRTPEKGKNERGINTNIGQAPGELLGDNWKSLKDTFSSGYSEIKNQLRF